MTTYYESRGEYLMRKGMDPYEQVDLQAEKIMALEKEIERLSHEIDVQCSSEYVERILKENERLRAVLKRIDVETSDEYAREIAREMLYDKR